MRELAKKRLGRLLIGHRGFFFGEEVSYMSIFALSTNYCTESSLLCWLHSLDSKLSILFWKTVSSVLDNSGFSKITKTVVISDAIDVINFLFGPFARHIKPRESVSQISAKSYVYLNISIRQFAPGYIARKTIITRPYSPIKYSGFLIVKKKFAKRFSGDLCHGYFLGE